MRRLNDVAGTGAHIAFVEGGAPRVAVGHSRAVARPG